MRERQLTRDVAEWRKKHGKKLMKGWRKILQRERAEAAYIDQLGRRLSEMGANGIKVQRAPFVRKGKPVTARFVSGGLPSLGKN